MEQIFAIGWEVKKNRTRRAPAEQAAKGICVKEKFKTAREKSQKKDKENRRRFKILARKVADMCSEKRSSAPAKHKTFQQYTRQHQACVKKTVEGTMSHKAVILWFIL